MVQPLDVRVLIATVTAGGGHNAAAAALDEAWHAFRPGDAVDRVIGSKKLAGMARSAKALGRPEAAREICGEIVRRLEVK